jgi:hypothetical protein
MSYDPEEFLGLRCHSSDAKFYICGRDSTVPGGSFLGCCASDPCGNNECPDDDLRSAGFDPNTYDYIPPQRCMDDTKSREHWFTCGMGGTFIGCCESNPCQGDGRCNSSSLMPAAMSDKTIEQQVWFKEPSPTTTSATTSGTSKPTDKDGGDDGGGGHNNVAVKAAVGAVGGVVGLLLIAGAIILFLRRKRRQTSPPVDLPPAWRHDTSNDTPPPAAVGGAPSTAALSPTIAASSPFLASPTTPHPDTKTMYPSGVSTQSSQPYNPHLSTQPSISPYGSPFSTPGPNETEFPHHANRQSTFSQGGYVPVSPEHTGATGPYQSHQPGGQPQTGYQGQTFAAELPADEHR